MNQQELTRSAIGVAFGNKANGHALAKLLREHGHPVIFTAGVADLESLLGASLVIVDQAVASQFQDNLQALKRSAEPVFLPILKTCGAEDTDCVRGDFDDVLRLPMPDAELHARLEAFLRLHTLSRDAHRRSEERFRTTFDNAASGIFHVARDGRILLANRRICEMLGYDQTELQSRSFLEITHPDDLAATISHRDRLSLGKANRALIEKRYIRKNGSVVWVEITVAVVRDAKGEPDYFVTVVNDVSERKVLEENLRKIGRARQVLAECSRILVHAVDEDALLHDMCSVIERFGGYRGAWIGVPQNDPSLSIEPVAWAGVDVDLLRRSGINLRPDSAQSRGAMGTAMATRSPAIVNDLATAPHLAYWRETARELGVRSVVAMPLLSGDACYGALAIYASEVNAFTEDEVELLDALAREIAFGINSLRTRLAHGTAQATLLTSEERFRSLNNLSSDWYWEQDENYRFVEIGGGGLRKLGLNHAWPIGKTRWESQALNPDTYLGFTEADWQAHRVTLESRLPFRDMVCRHRLMDGSIGCMSVSGEPIFDEHGSFRGYRGVGKDITSTKSMEDALRRNELRFRSLTKLSSDWYWEQDAQYRFISMTGGHPGSPEFDAKRHAGKTRWEVDYQDMSAEFWQAHRLVLDARKPFRDLVLRHRLADGAIRYVSVNGEPIFDESGIYTGYRGTGKDITAQKQAEEQLRISRERTSFLLSETPAVIYACSATVPRAITFISENVTAQLGYAPAEFLQKRDFWAERIHPDDRERVLQEVQAVLQTGRHVMDYRFRFSDGTHRWLRDEMRLVRDAKGRPSELIGYMIDVDEKKRFEQRLMHMAHFDSLTALPNRVLFHDRLRQTLAQASRNGWNTGVMFLDLDRFKLVNDTLGHATGDELLRQVSERLGRCVRSGDTVGRLGGDEFALILSDLKHPRDAQIVAQKVMKIFGKPFSLGGREMYVTASLGITVSPTDGDDPDTLVKNADTAMYRAKDSGRNKYQFYMPEMNSRALERLEFENQLRGALERGEFVLHYQPKFSVVTGEIVGMEALLRWVRDDNVVMPAAFIPLLEETGMITQVGEWVLRSACQQLREWERAGHAILPVAVNLSARQLQSPDLPKMVSRILRETGVRAEFLELEITESSLMHNTEEAVQILASLKKIGLRLSIDDFGTGYSSLSYLKRFPVDALKIDRSFVRDVTVDRDDAAITRAIITMAHQLQLSVIAEGVETPEQLLFLRSNGCDLAQGFHFSHPLPAHELTRMLPSAKADAAVA